MIARLRGRLDERGKDNCIVDVNGVGYLVRASARTLAALPAAGEACVLHIETSIREDAFELFGFVAPEERDCYRLLTTVQGVGPKAALALLSALAPGEIATAILSEDRATLTRADGVGPKLAQRIASELKDKVASLGLALATGKAAGGDAVPGAAPVGEAAADAVSALVNLGYRRAEAVAAVNKAAKKIGAQARVEALIPAGLKELGA
ncbi:MAG: Holliday junction branch migration protein RuvA [Alphaproteobacteria bacterium]|nr:Holliday junction branch migration protein RuvA [Alphaproteobacteria bacterium]